MALPFTTPAYEVTVERDVPYATAMGYWTEVPVGDKKALGKLLLSTINPQPVTLEMDIYKPVGDDTAERPLLLMMHGGSFLFGNKQEPGQAGWCQYFASLGYVAVSINYRLGFHARKKEFREAELRALEDADAALEYLLGREDLRIDPNLVFAAGTSAGAITALNLAFRLYGNRPMEEVTPRLSDGFSIRAVANPGTGHPGGASPLPGTPASAPPGRRAGIYAALLRNPRCNGRFFRGGNGIISYLCELNRQNF